MSDSDSASFSSTSDIMVHVKNGSPSESKVSATTKATHISYDDDSDDDSSFVNSDFEDERPFFRPRKSPAEKPTMRAADGEKLPPGISEEAFYAFFSREIKDHEEEKHARKCSTRKESLDLDSTDHLLKQHYDLMTKSLSELNLSQHSLKSLESFLDEIDNDLNSSDGLANVDFVVKDIAMKDASKVYKEERKKKKEKAISAPEVNEFIMKKKKRDERLEKVRERIRIREEKKKMEKLQLTTLDMSEGARRGRCYDWYKRLSMPSKEELKEKIFSLPPSTGVSPEDVELLPWNPAGRVVNPLKMQTLSTACRKSKKQCDEDSD